MRTPAAFSRSEDESSRRRHESGTNTFRVERYPPARMASPADNGSCATTGASAFATSRARTRPGGARWPARSSSRACCSTTRRSTGTEPDRSRFSTIPSRSSPSVRERLLRAVLAASSQVSVRIIPACDIDRHGLHRSNLGGLRAVLADLAPRAEICLVDGFRLGPLAPPHRAVVDGDTRSAAIAAASIVAKVTRDRIMRRLDALHPRYGFSRHVGYITPSHSAAVREHGPCDQHRLSYAAKCYGRTSDPTEIELEPAA